MFIRKEMPGLSNYVGEVINNKGRGKGIFVERMTQREPSPRYRVACLDCGTSWTEDQHRISFLVCKNSNCGKAPMRPGPSLANTASVQEGIRSTVSADAREFHRQESGEDINNSAPRKRSLRDGYFTNDGFRSDRERDSYRQFKQEFDEEQERPIREAAGQLQDTANKLARLERDQVASGIDSKFYLKDDERDNCFAAQDLDDEALSVTNNANLDVFFHSGAPYKKTPENAQKLLDYLQRNFEARGVPIGFLPSGALIRAYVRLDSFNLLERMPDPVVVETPKKTENYLDRLEREREIALRNEQERTGFDESGEPKVYTKRQIRAMTADQFKRAFFSRIAPTFTDLFSALSGR